MTEQESRDISYGLIAIAIGCLAVGFAMGAVAATTWWLT